MPSPRLQQAQADADARALQRGRRLRPIAWVLVALTLLASLGGDHPPGLDDARGVAVLVALVVIAAALWDVGVGGRPLWRYVVDAALLVVAGVALGALRGGDSTSIVSTIGVFLLAYRLPVDRAPWVAGAVSVAIAAASLATGGSDAASAAALLMLCALLAVVGLTMRRANESQDRAEELLAALQDARDEVARNAALAERTRIAGELHDILAHSLSGAALQLQGARRLMERRAADGTGADDAATAAVARAAELVRDGLGEAREAVAALRGGADAPLPTLDRVGELVARARRDLGLDAELDVRGEAARSVVVSPEASVALYRGAQEALTNAARHAPGARVAVVVEYAEDMVALTVTDDGGAGAEAYATASGATVREGLRDVGGGAGLGAMRERVERAGGRVVAGPREDGDGRGWRVRLEVGW